MTTIKTGFALMPAKAARAELSAADFKVLLVIGLHADKKGCAFPSMVRIAEIIGTRRGDIPRSLKRLEECGLLRRQRVPRANGGWQVNHYELVYEPLGDVSNTADRDVRNTADTQHVRKSADRCPQNCGQGVRKSAALTNHLTNQITKKAYQEETQKVGVGVINGGGVRNTADTPADEPAVCPGPNPGTPDPADAGAEGHGQIDPAVALDLIPPAALCRWPLGDGCDKPAVPGLSLCARHGR